MTFLRLGMAMLMMNEMRAVLRLVHLRDYEDIFRCILFVFRVHVVGYLTAAMDGVLVVTTKENINQNPRMFPSVVTYLFTDETVRCHGAGRLDVD